MVTLIRLLVLACLTAFAIATCQGKANIAVNPARPSSSVLTNCRLIQHDLGETNICGQPRKIVALGPYILESLLALGIQPIGFADDSILHQGNYGNPSQQIPYLGNRISQPLANVGSSYTPSMEALLKIRPDLIVGTESNTNQYETLSKIAPTLLLKWADSERSLRTIAQAVERSERAEQLLTETEQRIASARKTFSPFVAVHPQVLLLSSSQLQEINLGNAGHGRCSSLIKALGFQLIAPPGFDQVNSNSLVPISLETLPQLNEADSIILFGSNSSQLNGTNTFENHQLASLRKAWNQNAVAQSLQASKSKQVYFIPAYLCLGFPGPLGTELYLNELQKQLLQDL